MRFFPCLLRRGPCDDNEHERRHSVLVRLITNLEFNVMTVLSDLQDAVKAQDTVIDGVEVLLTGIADRLAQLTDGANPAALLALHDDIVAHTTALAAAAAAVPPAAPAPAPAAAPAADPTAAP